jgi:hypothetical protein
MYTITDSNACGVYPSTDTIYVQIHPLPSSGIQPHRFDFCDGGQVTLTANPGYTYYQWYYGGNSVYSNTITFTNTAANVNLTIKDSMNCTTIEHFQIFEHSVVPSINTSAQTYCSGDSVTLNVSPDFSAYIWSTGDTTDSITVFNGQFFSVMVSDSIGCQGNDSITINEIIIPQPNLYFDTLNCVLYTDSLPNTTYQWYYNGNPAGNDSSFISADSAGSYFLVILQNGCNSTSDTLNVNCLTTSDAGLNLNLPSIDFILFPDPASSVLTILNYQNLDIEITAKAQLNLLQKEILLK